MTTVPAKLFKMLLLSLVLGFSGLVLALPSPRDIEASVQAGQLDRAETQLREVLKARPDSARAHYELGQVLARQGRFIEAEQALIEARRLEPSLKFASSAQQFNELLARVSARTAAPATSPSSVTAAPAATAGTAPARSTPPAAAAPLPAPAPSDRGTPWGMILLGLAGVALVLVWLRRSAAARPAPVSGYPSAQPAEPRGFGHAYSPQPHGPAGAAPAYPPTASAGTGTGSMVRGAVVGGLAGLAAGYALSKAMDGAQQHEAPGRSGLQHEGDRAFDPVPVQPDLGAFDAGSGDGWDNAADNSGSDGGGDGW